MFVSQWEKWFQPEELAQAFTDAAIKLDSAKGSWWSVTAGPVATSVEQSVCTANVAQPRKAQRLQASQPK